MTPLIIVPARQMSQGRPCKNRESWPALFGVVSSLSWPMVVVTDDPCVLAESLPYDAWRVWLPMGPDHTVSQAVRYALQRGHAYEVVVVLQPSSPTRNRVEYVRSAVHLLETHPEATSVVSVVPWTGEPPSKACTLSQDGTLTIPPSPEPRQLQPQHYRRDGTVYAVRRAYAQAGDLYGPRPVPLLIHPDDSVTLD